MQHTAQRLTICMLSPYVPKHFGGGERYFFSVASYLSQHHDVYVAIVTDRQISGDDEQLIRSSYETFLEVDLTQVRFVNTPLFSTKNFWEKIQWTRQFDVMYYVTDGSLFFSFAKKNILHIQVPFTNPMLRPIDRLKLWNWRLKNTNSYFTKQAIERAWDTSVPFVHQPFVDTTIFKPKRTKEKIILHVGRFFKQLHSKRQDILISVFKEMIQKHPKDTKGWKFVLIGRVEDEKYAKEVAHMAKGLPIEIIHDATQQEIQDYFGKAQLYWHATGYGEEEFVYPQKMEHFGITTLEAMASGVIPIVINKGGQKEIVEHGVSGYLWNETDSLIEKTIACIRKEVDVDELSENAIERAEHFNPERFYWQIDEMLGVDSGVLYEHPQVSVVVPNYNGRKLMEKHLPAVLQAIQHKDEVVIVDDTSTDDSVSWLVKEFSLKKDTERLNFNYDQYIGKWKNEGKKGAFKLIVNKENQRFGESCNRGVREAEHDLIFLLNTDVKPHKNVLSALLPYFSKQNPKSSTYRLPIFAVGCNEIERNDEGKKVSGGRNTLWFERGLFIHSRANDFSSGENGWVSGGSGLFDKRKWMTLGGFDRAYLPAYWEDIDLSFRAKEKGWGVIFEEDAKVDHNHETTNKTAFGQEKIDIMSFKNAILFTWKNGSITQRMQFLCWLPYHLVITGKRTKWAFVKGFFAFLIQSFELSED